jgi:Protein of unknown function (DUF2510)/Bacterial PH domain
MIIRRRSGHDVTIRERFGGGAGSAWFLAVPCLVLAGALFILAGVQSHDYPPMAACLVAVGVVLAWLCVRLSRMGVRFDEHGVTVRNFWRTRRLAWEQVSYLTDGGTGWEWALRVVGRDGRTVTASGTRSRVVSETRTVKPETLTALGEVAERYGVSLEISGRVPARADWDGRGGRIPDAGGDAGGSTVIICVDHFGLSAGAEAIRVRSGRRVERFGWEEIGRFGNVGKGELVLQIVLRTGRTIQVPPAIELTDGELAAAIERLALDHDIPADLTGPAPRPATTGLYADPWDQPGVRYWDGTQWSPLLPRSVARRVKPAQAAWSELPVAEDAWTHAADAAKVNGRISAVSAALAGALAAVGLVVELVWDRGARPRQWSGTGWFGTAATLAAGVAAFWPSYLWYRRLDRAARESIARGKTSAGSADFT